MNGVIYARYSAGPNQTDQSIDGQIRDCREYAKRNGINILDTYIDRHISGTDFENRQEFNRLIKDSAKNQFSCVVVWKIDRFGRNREELAMSKVRLKKHGVKLLYAKEHIPDGPEGIILESILEGMAEYYSAELSQKVRRGLRESALKGRVVNGNPCLGYSVANKKYVYNPETAAIVREIFERYASGETALQIRDDLNRRGVRNSKGGPFNKNSIYYILRNEKYIGVYRYGDLVLDDMIPRIITQELWDRVSSILASNSRNRSKTRSTAITEFLLTGKLFCGVCKHTISGESGTGRNAIYYYYKCIGRRNKDSGCNLKIYRKEVLEEAVISITTRNVLTDAMIEHLIMALTSLQKNDVQSSYLKSMNKQLSNIQKSIDNMMKAIEMGIITDSTKDRLVNLEQQKDAMCIEIAREEIKAPDITVEQMRFWLQSFKGGDIKDVAFSIRLVNTFVNSIYLYDDYMIVVYNFFEGNGNRKAIEMDVDAIKKDQAFRALVGSDKPSQVRAAGLQTNHLLLVKRQYFIVVNSLKNNFCSF